VVLTQVAAVLIAKKMVLEAKTARDAAEMRALVDERVKDIAVKLGSNDAKSRLRPFPSSLSRLPELLFHLKRGPLLGSIVGHEDERAAYRKLYLQVFTRFLALLFGFQTCFFASV
jgi:protein transport protein SEC23